MQGGHLNNIDIPLVQNYVIFRKCAKLGILLYVQQNGPL